MTPTPRRTFLKQAATTGAGLLILRSGVLRGQSPNNKLNIALIGVGGRGEANLNDVRGENIVALCDVDANHLAAAAKRFPQAKTYTDWRKCLEQKDVQAVVCSTTDHTHAFISIWAMNRGLHVYCEKPLACSVEEARLVRATYLKHKGKLATQMGTQIHASDNYRRVVELVRGGAIGVPQEARVWCSREPKGGAYLPGGAAVPAHLDWDLWLGPAPHHPFNPGYLGGCLNWNRFWDFGGGQIGDMGSHLLDFAYWALDLKQPVSCKAEGTPVHPDTCPIWLTASWEHPANDWRPAVSVHWYDGGKKPGLPNEAFNREKLFKGMLIKGTKGYLLADYDFRILMPLGDMTHYQPPAAAKDCIPPSPGHHQEWIQACKNGGTPLCNFDYAGQLIEHNFLALAAYRAGAKLDWDGAAGRVTNTRDADAFLSKPYRDGWVLNG